MKNNLQLIGSKLTLCVAIVALSGCGVEEKRSASTDGKALAATACIRCHSLPSPSQLSPDDWRYLLAWMGNYLGHQSEIPINPVLVDQTAVPPVPVVTRAQFDAICTYYLEAASTQYNAPAVAPAPSVSQWFELVPFANLPKTITMVAFDGPTRAILIGSSEPAQLTVLERGATTTLDVQSEPVTYERLGSMGRVALIGDLRGDSRRGQVFDLDFRDGSRHVIVDKHHRIAAHGTANVDGDHFEDLLVCGFGDYPAGRVAIWWGGPEGLTEQVLFLEAGATWCDIADFDNDGDQDILLAIANARPRLLAFVNEGDRRLVPRVIVERPVGWGYNRCLVVDWDGDGLPDVVELAGNNLELRGRPLKAHHGVRVLRNVGNWRFDEVLFERLHGAIDVAAGDFDGNGRMDLGVTAFFPDWRVPVPTTFLLLMQQTDGTVKRETIDDQYWNRWMRISAGDVDGDGDTDLLLGAAQVPQAIPPEDEQRYARLLQGKASVLLLRNKTSTPAAVQKE